MPVDSRKLQPVVVRTYVPLMSDFFMRAYAFANYPQMYFCSFYLRCAYINGKYYYGPESRDFGFELYSLMEKEPSLKDKVFSRIYSVGDALLQFVEALETKDLAALEKDAILALFREFAQKYELFSISLAGFNLQFPVEEGLQKLLEGRPKAEEEVAILSFPRKLNHAAMEQEDLLRIASLPQEQWQEACQIHAKNFGWINARGGTAPCWSVDDIRARAAAIDHPQEQYERIKDHQKHAKEQSDTLVAELGKQAFWIVELAKELVYYRTYRTDHLNRTFVIARPLLDAVARVRGLSYEDVLHLRVDEIAQDLSVDTAEIERRKKGYLLGTMQPNELTFSSDQQEIAAFTAQHCEEFTGEGDEVKGAIANKGKATGTARIVLSKQDLAKVQTGDILITPMTTPDYVTAMQKAAAFVTDEGGITCHAAIVSRELHKPCVIGTKVATKLFKDGETIEVDANTGLVKKISR